MKNKKNFFSVIIPTYNRPKTLLKSINSVLNQNFKNFEIIVVDDCSKLDLKINKKKIRYMKLKKNSGVSISRNIGAKISKGKFLAFLDDDDKWPKDYLLKTFKKIQLTKKKIFLSKIKIRRKGKLELFKNSYSKLILNKLFLYNPGITGSNLVIEKKTFFKIGGYNKNLYVCEDKGLIIDVIIKKINNEIFVQRDNFIIYKQGSNSLSQKKNLIKSKLSLLKVYKKTIPTVIKLKIYLQILLLFFINTFKKL